GLGGWLRVLTPPEWLGGLLLLVWAAALLGWGRGLPGWLHFALWAGWAACLLVLLRRGWQWLVGPVFYYDLIRSARRDRHILYRCLYALSLLLALCWVYWEWQTRVGGGEGLDAATEMPRFAGRFFGACLLMQF